MNKQDKSISMAKANVYSLAIALPVIAVLVFIFILRWGSASIFGGLDQLFGNFLVFLTIFLMGIVLHEFIHGISWMIFGRKPYSAIKFGFQLKTITPYAHIREPLPVNAYRIGTFMPGGLLGILPALIAIVTGNGWLMAFGLLFTFAAGGDFLILWLLRNVSKEKWIEDHPTNAGCFVLDPTESSGFSI